MTIKSIAIYGKSAETCADILLHNECTYAASKTENFINQLCPDVNVYRYVDKMSLTNVKRDVINQGFGVFIYLTVMHYTKPLKKALYNTAVNVNFVCGDVSLWSVVLSSEITKRGLLCFQHINDGKIDREMLQNDCIPITICMGSYHSSQELRKIYEFNVPLIVDAIGKTVQYFNQPQVIYERPTAFNTFRQKGAALS